MKNQLQDNLAFDTGSSPGQVVGEVTSNLVSVFAPASGTDLIRISFTYIINKTDMNFFTELSKQQTGAQIKQYEL